MASWLAVGGLMAVILFNSSIAGSPISGSSWISFLVSKVGHVVEYSLLGWLIQAALTSARGGFGLPPRRTLVVAAAIGLGFAAADEVRQLFVYSRTGQPADVALDALSVLPGALLRQPTLRDPAGAAEVAGAADRQGDQPAAEDEHQQVHRQHLAIAVDVRQERDHDREVGAHEQVEQTRAQRTGRR